LKNQSVKCHKSPNRRIEDVIVKPKFTSKINKHGQINFKAFRDKTYTHTQILIFRKNYLRMMKTKQRYHKDESTERNSKENLILTMNCRGPCKRRRPKIKFTKRTE